MTHSSTSKNIKVLIIEDAEALRSDIVEMLKFEGFDVRGAENGLIGVDVAREYLPDIIICDIMMPELDGYGVLNALRQEATTANIPFVFLTAKTDRSDVRHGMGLGADDYLTKPFVASELLDAIRVRVEKSENVKALVDDRIRNLSDSIITALPHELRTPLNTILGFSDMIMMEANRLEPEKIIDWAKHINEAGQRLYRLVENYLLYVRTEIIARDDLESESHKNTTLDHPNTVIQFQIMNRLSDGERYEDLKMDLMEDEPIIHITDHDLGKIVEELIDNAIKFSETGTAIELKTYIDEETFIVEVKDYGRGMTPEQINAIGAYMQFERWLYEQQGTGLGLAIVRRLMDIYNGEFTIVSEPQAWTCASVKIPLVRH